MSLGPHLLHAMIAAGGDAVVMHTGDLPYIATASAEAEVGTEPLTFNDIDAVLAELLPPASLRTFNRLGAVRYECPPLPDYPGQRFTVVAYRETDELWVEVRRDSGGARALPGAPVAQPSIDPVQERPLDRVEKRPVDRQRERSVDRVEAEPTPEAEAPAAAFVPAVGKARRASEDPLALPSFEELWPNQIREQTVHSSDWRDGGVSERPQSGASDPPAGSVPVAQDSSPAPRTPDERPVARGSKRRRPRELDLNAADAPKSDSPLPPSVEQAGPRQRPAPPGREHRPAIAGDSGADDLEGFELDDLDRGMPPPPSSKRQRPPTHKAPAIVPEPPPTPDQGAGPAVRAVPPRQGVVVPMSRNVRNGPPEPLVDLTAGGLVHLLRMVAARGGSTLYIASDAQPSMRIDGEMQALEGVEPLSAVDVETLLLGVMPERTHEALRTGERTEWISEVPDLGRVRCVSFWDHRGAGGIFRILTARVVTAEQLGLTREVQALALQPEGLILIAGPRSSGKSTLISAFVDLINRTRRDHVITIENEIQVVHESRGSMISQREVRGEGQGLLAAIGVALREDPDVLAIEELRGEGVMQASLEAAGSGRLVIGGLPAHSAADAIDRVFDRFTPDQQLHAQLALAENLRGIIVQTLLRKPGGGRVAAREVLLNTPAVASLIADGRTSQLSLAIEAGRKVGMISLNESMVALVKSSAVDVREAYRRAADRQGLVALLKRHGVDTSPIERLA